MSTDKINLRNLGACSDAVKWMDSQKNNIEAWKNCTRGDWMLWIAAKLKVNPRKLILAKAYCAKTVYPLLQDERSKDVIVTAINYGRGLATDEELKDAAEAAETAYVAARAAYADYAAEATYAAYAATYVAAKVADYADYAADYAAEATYTAYAAAYTAYAAASYAAEATAYVATEAAYNAYTAAEATYTAASYSAANNNKKTADICRKYLTEAVFEKYQEFKTKEN